MSLMQPADEEVLLRLEDQTNDLSSQNWRLPRFNKASMLAVGLLLCMASTATARLAGFSGKIEAVALWDEFFDFGSPDLDSYRRQISHHENSKSLVSWQDVMCSALREERGTDRPCGGLESPILTSCHLLWIQLPIGICHSPRTQHGGDIVASWCCCLKSSHGGSSLQYKPPEFSVLLWQSIRFLWQSRQFLVDDAVTSWQWKSKFPIQRSKSH